MKQNRKLPIFQPDVNTVLIVDDDEINREILHNLFADYYEIMEAEDGLEGLDMIRSNSGRICAVLLDVKMPKMNGLEVLEKLQEEKLLERIPVFLITAEIDVSMKKAYEIGAMDVIGQAHCTLPGAAPGQFCGRAVSGQAQTGKQGGGTGQRAAGKDPADSGAEPGND